MPKVRNPSKLWTHFVEILAGERGVRHRGEAHAPIPRGTAEASGCGLRPGHFSLVRRGLRGGHPTEHPRSTWSSTCAMLKRSRACHRWCKRTDCVNPFIMDHTGNVIWSER